MDLLRNSRTLKAITDGSELDFEQAEARIAAVRIVIIVGEDGVKSAAGQACALTAMVAAKKSFRNVALILRADVPLIRPVPGGLTLARAAEVLGVTTYRAPPRNATHAIVVGSGAGPAESFTIHCCWDGWATGIRNAVDVTGIGASWNPLCGSFAAALAVREIFAHVRGKRGTFPRSFAMSMWEPWSVGSLSQGPTTVHLTRELAIVGLGHLGQGFIWNLMLLPGHGERLLLWDYQMTGDENVGTGVLTYSHDTGARKARVAARWAEFYGWRTTLNEMQFRRGHAWATDDPPLVVSALDSPQVREWVLASGFPQMIDIGVGHGPSDFEYGQLRIMPAGTSSTWTAASKPKDVSALLKRPAYEAVAKHNGCGAFDLANSSVAVPFVGLAMGAVAVAQILRLAAMEPTRKLLQLELSSPDMPSASSFLPALTRSLGSVELALHE
jgi:hypothetical protein